MEIITHRNYHMALGQVVLGLMSNPVVNFLRSLRSIVCGQLLIDDERFVVTKSIEVESAWCTVVVIHCVGEDFRTITECVVHRSLDPLH
jgi:hypothetical protein